MSNKPDTALNFEHTADKHNSEMWWVIAIYITRKKTTKKKTRFNDGTVYSLPISLVEDIKKKTLE